MKHWDKPTRRYLAGSLLSALPSGAENKNVCSYFLCDLLTLCTQDFVRYFIFGTAEATGSFTYSFLLFSIAEGESGLHNGFT